MNAKSTDGSSSSSSSSSSSTRARGLLTKELQDDVPRLLICKDLTLAITVVVVVAVVVVVVIQDH